MPMLTKNDIGKLEYELYTGHNSLIHLATLHEEYTRRNMPQQADRIAHVMERKIKKIRSTDNRLVVTIEEHTTHYSPKKRIIFADNMDNVSEASRINTLEQIISLVRYCGISDVVIDKAAQQEAPQFCELLKNACTEFGKPCRLLSQGVTNLSAQKLGQDDQDAKNVARLLDAPTEIAIMTFVRQCNIRCRFCEQAYHDIESREMSPAIFQQSIEALPHDRPLTVGLTPFMEPLIEPRFLDYAEMACRLRPKAQFVFNTNGVPLTEKIAQRLIDMQFPYIHVSLNMPSRESYRHFCGHDFFDRVVANIKGLHALKQRTGSQFPKVGIQFLNLAPVPGNEETLYAQWHEWADKGINFRNVTTPVMSQTQLQSLREQNIEFPETQVVRQDAWPCASMMVTCGIDHQGYYVPCCNHCIQRGIAGKRKYKFMEIGHVRDMDILTAWRSEKWNQLRSWQLAGLIRVCRKCQINETSENTLLHWTNGVMRHCYKV